MTTRIHDLAKEIKYLKSNLSTVEGSFKMRMQEEIQNLEFDMEYLKRNNYSHQSNHDRTMQHAPNLVH